MKQVGSILITGGTGSFGFTITCKLLQQFPDTGIVVYSRNEFLQHAMRHALPEALSSRVRFVIGDVRDEARLREAMQGADTVIHTAALKHVSTCEQNPTEAVKTNVTGTQNVVRACLENKVARLVHISTDKAANPAGVYGNTKHAAEKLVIDPEILSKAGSINTAFTILRFGNLIGSSGSVVYRFQEQGKQGVIRVTDPGITRFNLNPHQLMYYLTMALQPGNHGHIIVPKLKSYRLPDLAQAIAPNTKLEVVGLRAGEKLYEELLIDAEAPVAQGYADHFAISYQGNFKPGGSPLPSEFSYASSQSDNIMSLVDLQNEIRQYVKPHYVALQ
jgi:UDP-N-acetylglucosamine 4,6-dehydratase